MHSCLLVALLAVGAVSPAVPQPAALDISGTWELSVTTSRGTESATLTLKKDGEGYSGTAVRAADQAQAPATAVVKDKAVTITIVAQTSSGPMTVTMKGDVAGDTMSGTGDYGSRGTGPWSAKRAPAAAADVMSGTWAVEVDTGQGTGTPTFTLKQEGEKLSGQYRGLFGEAPVTGTIKGNTFEFSVNVTVEGNTVRVTYAGTVEKDAMKGTVKFGDIGQGTFKGTRKP